MSDTKDPKKVAAGRKGGKRTAEKYGSEYMRQIGQAGFAAAQERFANNPYVLNKYLQKKGATKHLGGVPIGTMQY